MRYGFTTLRDMGTLDQWTTANLRDAIDSGMARGPRPIVASHMISATAGHGDMQSMSRADAIWDCPGLPTLRRKFASWSAWSTHSAATGSSHEHRRMIRPE